MRNTLTSIYAGLIVTAAITVIGFEAVATARPSAGSSVEIVNRMRKGDRLPLVQTNVPRAAANKSRLPEGCDRPPRRLGGVWCRTKFQYCRWPLAWVVVSTHRCGRVAIGPEQPGGISILIGRTSSWYGKSLLPPGSPPNLIT